MMDRPQGESEVRPIVYVIAGPNGAGKTTFATEFLPGFAQCREFLNADLIAAGLSPFAPAGQNVRAARLLLERMQELMVNREDFGFETTLAGRTYLNRLNEIKRCGYRVVLFFLWIPNVEMAIARVANRVKQGGHDIPIADIRRRYTTGLKNLFNVYRPILDEWWLFDGSFLPPTPIANEKNGELKVTQQDLYLRIINSLETPCED